MMAFNIRTALVLACTALALLLNGCATVPEEGEEEVDTGPWIWPTPPDQPRYGYVMTLRGEADIKPPEEEDALTSLFAGQKEPKMAFEKPFGIAARGGRIFITDTQLRQVVVFDIPRRKVFYFGVRLEGALKKPLGIALDRENRIYVADVSERRIVVYDQLGLFLRTIGSADDLARPTGVAVAPAGDRIYVVDDGGIDTDAHRIVVYDHEGKKLFVIGKRGKEDGEFNLPIGAAVGPDGTLYVLDTGNFRIQAFDRDGKFLRKWGKVGNSFGDFSRARAIAVDDENKIYVADSVFGNIQIFNADGEILMPIGTHSSTTDGPGKFGLPAGVAVDEKGFVYIVDQLFNKIEVLKHLNEEEAQQATEEFKKRKKPDTPPATESAAETTEIPNSENKTDAATPVSGNLGTN